MTHEELESIKKLVGSAFADGYQIISVLGTGGSSIVYRARYEPLDRDVALKLLRVDEKSGADVVRLLKTEARNASRLQHPNIVPVLRINTADDGTPFLVTEFADGVSLADLLQQRGGRLNETEFFKVFDDIMDGLEYAHSNNVVHCDLKPSNIIVRLDGNDIVQARILDFGISRIVSQHATNSSETASGIFGTPAYMSPEQCLGKKPDKRTDIYSLGCMMYEAVSGRKVFEGESAFQIIHEHTSTPPTPFAKLHKPVQVGSRIENGIMAALRKERSERPQSVAELRSILHGETTYVRPGSFSPVGRTRVSRKGLLAVATAATILAVCAAVFLKVNNAETDGGAGGGDRGGDSAAAGYNGGYSAAGGYNGGYMVVIAVATQEMAPRTQKS